jgi:aryl-alcohol dehydrogenase-like predicted oxidoreductase
MTTTGIPEIYPHNQNKIIYVGTANFNKNYGFGQRSSVFQSNDLDELFSEIQNNENIYLETSQNYEGVEELIGKYAKGKLRDKIAIKISPNKYDTANSIISLVNKSLEKVGQKSFQSVLLHNPEILSHENNIKIVKGLEQCINLGLTKSIGISSYESQQILELKKKFPQLTNFQINENVVDQRNYKNNDLISLSKSGNKIFVRSIFLQGNLLVNYSDLPEFLIPQQEIFKKFIELCDSKKVSQIKCCLDYVKQISWSNGIIVGIKKFTELTEIIENFSSIIEVNDFSIDVLSDFYSDPRNWINS